MEHTAHAADRYYVPHGTRWPILGSIGLFLLLLGAALLLNQHAAGLLVSAVGGVALAVMLFGWFATVIAESERGVYNQQVDASFRWGMSWFIFSEVMFFAVFFGTLFYVPAAGADPLLWQHLFWIFGHPEVYILILPAMGIVSEVLPTFARKPLFGAPVVIYSGILIGFFGFGVWSHHMFTVGMGPIADAAFAIGTMIIAIPISAGVSSVWRNSTKPMLEISTMPSPLQIA